MLDGESRVAPLSAWRENGARHRRITAVFHVPGISGPAKTLAPRLRSLAGHHAVEVVAPSSGALFGLFPDAVTRTILDYSAATFPANPAAVLRAGHGLTRELRSFRSHFARTRPDLVIVVTSAVPAALAAARLTRTPTIVYVSEMYDRPYSRGAVREIGAAVLTRFIAASADAVVCSSEAVARQFARLPNRSVVTIPPGVNGADADGDREGFRRRHQISADAVCLAVAGDISPGRGQDVAIEAVALLRAEIPDIWCVIAGAPHARPSDIAYRDSLSDLAARLGVADRVKFTGFVDRVADVYAAADIVVNPARTSEAFGRVALEALVAGRPVVATRVGAVPEVLRDREDALLVPPGSPEAIASAVVRLWRDEELRERLVATGRERVLREFSEQEGVERFADVVARVLGRPDADQARVWADPRDAVV